MTRTLLLPDVNVWIAMTFDSHPHHPVAKLWFDAITDELIFFCRMTQQGFLRLSTNPKVAEAHALTMTGAWQMYDEYLGDPRIGFAVESQSLESRWRSFSQGGTFSPKVWNDAYLAAFAMAGSYELVTFDKGFARYSGLSHTLLI